MDLQRLHGIPEVVSLTDSIGGGLLAIPLYFFFDSVLLLLFYNINGHWKAVVYSLRYYKWKRLSIRNVGRMLAIATYSGFAVVFSYIAYLIY